MTRSGVDRALSPSTGNVTRAILIGAKKRTSALYAIRYTRLAWIKTVGRAFRICRDVAKRGQRRIVVGAIPIRNEPTGAVVR